MASSSRPRRYCRSVGRLTEPVQISVANMMPDRTSTDYPALGRICDQLVVTNVRPAPMIGYDAAEGYSTDIVICQYRPAFQTLGMSNSSKKRRCHRHLATSAFGYLTDIRLTTVWEPYLPLPASSSFFGYRSIRLPKSAAAVAIVVCKSYLTLTLKRIFWNMCSSYLPWR